MAVVYRPELQEDLVLMQVDGFHWNHEDDKREGLYVSLEQYMDTYNELDYVEGELHQAGDDIDDYRIEIERLKGVIVFLENENKALKAKAE